MNVIDSIFSYFLNTEKKLVFTSETIARNYLMNFVSTNPNKAIFKDRALSWDSFLLSLLDTKEKKAVTKTERKTFSYSFLKNGGLEKLEYFSSPLYKESIMSYANSISAYLPFFPSNDDEIRKHMNQSMLNDIDKLRSEYEKYLIENKLFEKNYLNPDFSLIKKGEYVFVFPETFTSTIAEKIVSLDLVETIKIPQNAPLSSLKEYENSLIEIRRTMEEIEKDREKYSDSDISITSSSLSSYKPYLISEAKKRDIPLVFTSSEALSSYPEGKLVRAMYNTVKSNWDIEETKRLLLNPVFPFKDRESLVSIVRKAIDNKLESHSSKDWLKILSGEERELFYSVSKTINEIVRSNNSQITLEKLKFFRDTFFSSGEWNEEEDLVFGTVLDILRDISPSLEEDTFRFFLSLIEETPYVEKSDKKSGIRVYNYPASCGLITKVHYIIGLDDKTTEKKIDDYPYLVSLTRPESTDLTTNILSLYASPIFTEKLVISGTKLGFDGARLLPSLFLDSSFFDKKKIEDEYYAEKKLWRENKKPNVRCSIYQAESYKKALSSPLKGRKEKVTLPLSSNDKKEISVSTVKEYDLCPYRGYVQDILNIREKNYSPLYEDPLEIGKILHSTVEKALEEAKTIANIDVERMEYIFIEELEKAKKHNGLTTPYSYSHILGRYIDNLEKIISSNKASIYSEYKLVGNEIPIENYPLNGNISIKGRVDTLLKDKDGYVYVIDWKTSGTSDYNTSDVNLVSLQLILYSLLLENDKNYAVKGGAFYSFKEGDYKVVWPVESYQSGNNTNTYHNGFTEDVVTLNAKERLDKIKDNLEKGNFTPLYSERGCSMCKFMRLCREKFVAQLEEDNE